MQLTRKQIEQVENIRWTTWWKVFMDFMLESITEKFMWILDKDIDPDYVKIQYSEMQVDQKAYRFFKDKLKEFEKQLKVVENEKIREKQAEQRANEGEA